MASRLLTNATISARISELQAAGIKRVELNSDTILKEIRRLALSDIGELFDDEGLLLPIKQMPREIRACISSIEVKEDEGGVTTTKIKLWPKGQQLALAAQHLELLVNRIEVSDEIIERRISKMTEDQRTARAKALLDQVRSLCGSAK